MRLNYYIAMVSMVAFEDTLAALQLGAPQKSAALAQDNSLAQMWNPVTSVLNYVNPARATALASTGAPPTKEELEELEAEEELEELEAEAEKARLAAEAATKDAEQAKHKAENLTTVSEGPTDLRKVLDGNGDGKLQDSEIGILFSKVNDTKDGKLTKY